MYITKFKNKALILKDVSLQKTSTKKISKFKNINKKKKEQDRI